MRWNQRPKTERPEYPKLVPIPGTIEEARERLPMLRNEDPEAEIVDGGDRGAFARVHNAEAEAAARQVGEKRDFPLA